MGYMGHPKSAVTFQNSGSRGIVSFVWNGRLPFSLADGDVELEQWVQSVLFSKLQRSLDQMCVSGYQVLGCSRAI